MKMRACWHSSHQFHCSTRRSSWLTSIYRRSLMPSIWLIGTHSLTDGRGCCPSLSFWPFLSWVSYPPERPDFLMNRRRRPGASSAEAQLRSEEHTSELQSLMRISYAVFCLQKQNITISTYTD